MYDDDYIELIRDWYKSSMDHLNDRYTEIKEEFDFYAARQWSEADKTKLDEEDRPIITFNRVAPVINSVTGFETSNRDEVKFLPRTQEDGMGNQMYTQVAKWNRDETDADDEQSEAFKDMVICGYGWTYTDVDYDENPDGLIKESRLPPLEMFYDPTARKANLVDATYFGRAKKYTRRQMDQLWPGKAQEIVDNEAHVLMEHTEPHAADQDWKYENDQQWNTEKQKFLVLHCQWCEREPYYRYVETDGSIKEVPVKEGVEDKLQMLGVQYVKQRKKVWYQATIAGKTVLEPKKKLIVDGLSQYQCMTGYRDERKNVHFGLMKLMIDPQRWANKFFSQFLDIVASNAKGGLMAERNAFENPEDAERDWADPSKIVMLKEGAIGKIKERTTQPFPSATDRLLQIAVAATRDVTGINLEFLGLANRDQAQVLESERKRSALVILSDLFNSLRRFKRKQGRILLQFIHKTMREGQIIRIVGEEGIQYTRFIKDPSALTYDVIVDTAPDSPNMKQEAWSVLRELIPTLISANIPVPPQFVKLLPLPESYSQEWIKYIEQQGQDPMAEQLKQLQLAEQQANVEETKSKAALNMAKAQAEGQQQPPDPLEVARIENEKLRIIAEQEKIKIEADLKMQELGAKRFDSEAKIQQANSRIEEAKIKAEAEIAKAQIDYQKTQSESKREASKEPSEQPKVELPEIHVNIDQSGNKTVEIKKNKDGSMTGKISNGS